MTTIVKGQRIALDSLLENNGQVNGFQVGLYITGNKEPVDFACLGLDSQQKLSDDAYMIFFNQPKTPCGAVELLTPTGDLLGLTPTGDLLGFYCQLAKLPVKIDRLVFTVAVDGSASIRQIEQGYLRFLVADRELARFTFLGSDFNDEKAVILGELYRKNGTWRFSAVGQGFNGGMAALVKHFGGEVTEDAPEPVSPVLSLEKKLASAPQLINLAKKATLSLEKHHLQTTVARVGLVLDASGSMSRQYSQGKVQAVINRLLPLAVHFDDDGELDVWAFSRKVLALPVATLKNYIDFINTAEHGWRNWGMMSANDEPGVIKKVIEHYQKTRLPVFVIFISDGGVSQDKVIKQLLIEAASLPIFWQFVGIGGRNYGVLEQLDTMVGRLVDNCGFFALDDIDSISEQELYDRLLSEFPLWLKEAKTKNIL